MNTIPASEIKRRGISAVDELLEKGPVHVIRENRPQYVVLSQQRYEAMMEDLQEAAAERLRASLADVAAGRVRRFSSADELMAALDELSDEDGE